MNRRFGRTGRCRRVSAGNCDRGLGFRTLQFRSTAFARHVRSPERQSRSETSLTLFARTSQNAPSGSEQTLRVCERRKALRAFRKLNRRETFRACGAVAPFRGCDFCQSFTLTTSCSRCSQDSQGSIPAITHSLVTSVPRRMTRGSRWSPLVFSRFSLRSNLLCAVRELNPGFSLGKAMSYHWTNGALVHAVIPRGVT